MSQSLTVLLCKKKKEKDIASVVLIWSQGADCAPKSWTVFFFFFIVLHVFVLKFHICDELLPCAVRQTHYLTISTYQHVDYDWGNQVQAEGNDLMNREKEPKQKRLTFNLLVPILFIVKTTVYF